MKLLTMETYFITIIVAGIVATALMNLFVQLISFIVKEQFKVIRVLGTMLTGETTYNKKLSKTNKSFFAGAAVHYLIGCFFSYLYYLWCGKMGGYSFLNTIVFGLAIAVIAFVAWNIFFYVHSNPPRLFVKDYITTISSGHFVFSFALMFVYNFQLL